MSYRFAIWGSCLLATLFLLTQPVNAQGIFGQSPAKATLMAQQSSIQPGSTMTVGVLLTPDEGWHTYWINPGESGLPTKITWELPDGFTAGDIQWPTPHTFETGGIIGLGYGGPVLLTVPITAPKSISQNSVTLKAKASWLVCKEACIPGRASLSIVLPVKNVTPAIDPANKKLFADTINHLPKPIELKSDQASVRDGQLKLTLPNLTVSDAVFYSANESLIDTDSKQTVTVNTSNQTTTITVPLSKYAPKTITRITGVVVADPHAKVSKAYAIDMVIK